MRKENVVSGGGARQRRRCEKKRMPSRGMHFEGASCCCSCSCYRVVLFVSLRCDWLLLAVVLTSLLADRAEVREERRR